MSHTKNEERISSKIICLNLIDLTIHVVVSAQHSRDHEDFTFPLLLQPAFVRSVNKKTAKTKSTNKAAAIEWGWESMYQ